MVLANPSSSMGRIKDRLSYYMLRIVHLDSYSVELENAPATLQAFN